MLCLLVVAILIVASSSSSQEVLAFTTPPYSISSSSIISSTTRHHLRGFYAPSSTSLRLGVGDFFNNLVSGGNSNSNSNGNNKQPPTKANDAPEERDEGYYDNDDPIEKIFTFFFGKKEESPLGMPRFGQQRFPEQYPATITEYAAPVATDTVEMSTLRPLLKNTNLEYRKLRLTYDANQHGWDPTSFHNKVDRQGGAIVLCTTSSGKKVGGYNPKGWVGYGEARGSIAAFLFILNNNNDKSMPQTKLRKVGGPGLAQMDEPETGPQFSPDALVIRLDKRNPKIARSKLGSYYERLPDGTNSLFGKDNATAQLTELKVYHGVYDEGEYVPFTDAEPFALY